MDLQLKDKRVFISGSTAGIGLATAKLFVQEGANVILNGRSMRTVKLAKQLILDKYPNASVNGIAADFKNDKSVTSLINQLENIDILINNVGIYTAQSFDETTDADWMDMFEVNVMSAVKLSRALLPDMIERNWGRIINISSECAQLVPEDLIAYSATKSAMLGLSRGLAQLTKGTGVTVNAILPGSTLSEGAGQFLKDQAEKEQISEQEVAANFFKNVRASSLLQRFAKTEEVATTIVYLSSPRAVITNGAAIKADGGSIPGIL